MNSKEVVVTGTSNKRHKKHKHKKHRKKKVGLDDHFDSSSPEDGVKSMNLSDFPVVQLNSGSSASSSLSTPEVVSKTGASTTPKSSKKKSKPAKGDDSETSEEEQRWLDAIQEGKLEEVEPELKNMKTKDPKLMTARQRAMLVRKGDPAIEAEAEELISLPSGYKEKVMTPEMIKKAEANKEKMRKLHDEKRAKEKKRTLERLLRKQEAKGSKANNKKIAKKIGLTVKLINNLEEIKMLLPLGMEYPIQVHKPHPPVGKIKCGVENCNNHKRYSCSKTNIPLCSLACYKKNLALHLVK